MGTNDDNLDRISVAILESAFPLKTMASLNLNKLRTENVAIAKIAEATNTSTKVKPAALLRRVPRV
jgi:hypothetical protein